jgi:hypothetical protein
LLLLSRETRKPPVSFLDGNWSFLNASEISFQESNAMDLRNILSPHLPGKPRMKRDSSRTSFRDPAKAAISAGKEEPSAGDYQMKAAPDLRSVVERRFRRMTEAHDRIRAALLAPHSRNFE